MTIYNPRGNHTKYTETDRHFSPKSERYTGADSLITAQRNGWRLINIAYEEQIEMRGGRHTTLYYFKLTRNNDKMIMPIIATPFVERMLLNRRVVLLPFPPHENSTEYSKTVEMAAVRVHKG
ncbi:MAG: hypothetical protein ACFE0Q_02140 [Anaerolineae bacterium]